MTKKENKKYNCFRCNHKITQKKDAVSEGYFGACLNCDEDMFEFECIEITKKETA